MGRGSIGGAALATGGSNRASVFSLRSWSCQLNNAWTCNFIIAAILSQKITSFHHCSLFIQNSFVRLHNTSVLVFYTRHNTCSWKTSRGRYCFQPMKSRNAWIKPISFFVYYIFFVNSKTNRANKISKSYFLHFQTTIYFEYHEFLYCLLICLYNLIYLFISDICNW